MKMLTKNCYSCKKIKTEKDFSVSAFKAKKSQRCRECALIYDKKWKERNREKIRKQAKIRYEKNPEKHRKKSRDFMRNLKKNNIDKYINKIWTGNLKRFGLTPEKYKEILTSQNEVCAICFEKETSIHPQTKKIIKLSVDHCHETGIIRGLLCNRCNPMIGYSRSSIKIHLLAIEYLKRAEKNRP